MPRHGHVASSNPPHHPYPPTLIDTHTYTHAHLPASEQRKAALGPRELSALKAVIDHLALLSAQVYYIWREREGGTCGLGV